MKLCEIDWKILKDILLNVLGISTALYVFYLGKKHEKRKEVNKENDLRMNRLLVFANLIKASNKHVQEVIKNINTNISTSKKNYLKSHVISHPASLNLNRVMNLLNNESYFLSYVEYFKKEKINQFNAITSTYDYFNTVIPQVLESKNKNLQHCQDYHEKFSSKIHEVFITINKQKNIPDFLTSEEELEIDLIIDYYKKNIIDQTDYDFYLKNVVNKVLDTKKFITKDSNETRELKSILQESQAIINNLILINETHIDILSISLNDIENAYLNIKTNTKELFELLE